MINYYFTDELYHHGVKGMKWGVRRKAKDYQKQLNKLDTRQNQLLATAWEYADSKQVADSKRRKYEQRGNYAKADRWLAESKILNKKYKT